MAKQTINPGAAPIVWSTVDEAFRAINDNFTELYLTVSGGPGSVIDLTDLGTNLIPRDTEFYDLGSAAKRWKDLYLSGSSLHLGSAILTATGSSINLPAGSTIGGSVLDNEYFREIAVAGQNNIVADAGGTDILTVASGTGISLTTNDTTDTLTIANSGVTSLTTSSGLSINTSAVGAVSITNTGVTGLTAGAGISVNQSTGPISISNTGVLSVTTFGGSGITINNPSPGVFEFVNSLPNVQQDTFRSILVAGQATVQADNAADNLILLNGTGINITTDAATDTITFTNTGVTTLAGSGAGISVSAATGSVNISNTGVTSLVAGSGISVSTGTGAVTVTNTRFGFQNFAVASNPNPIQADNDSDTFTFVAGEGVVLIPNPTNDSLEINVSFINGNVFAHDSTLLIDAAGSQILGDINTARLRTSETQIALGFRAGATSQGANSIAIGNSAGFLNQPANSIIINASGSVLNGSAAGFYVEPIREDTGPQVLYYDPTGTKEITWGPVPSGGGGGGGGGGENFEFNVAGDDSTMRTIFSGETLRFAGAGGITTTTDGEGRVTITGPTLATVATSGNYLDLSNRPSLATVATSGNYLDLSNQPSIPAAYSVTSIDALSDVDTSTTPPTNGQSLVWSTASSKWLPSTVTGGGGSALQSRTSISASTISIADGASSDITLTAFKSYALLKIQTSHASWVRLYVDGASRTADSSRAEGVDPSPGAGVIAEVITTGAQTILMSPGVIGFNNDGTGATQLYVAVKNKSGSANAITVTCTVLQLEA